MGFNSHHTNSYTTDILITKLLHIYYISNRKRAELFFKEMKITDKINKFTKFSTVNRLYQDSEFKCEQKIKTSSRKKINTVFNEYI